MYKWDEMAEKERDWLLADAFKIVDKQGFDWAWESGAYSFTTKIKKAWIIVAKLQEMRWHVQVNATPNPDDGDFGVYMVRPAGYEKEIDGFIAFKEPIEEIESSGTTVSEAICKAALKSIGVEIV